MVTSQILKSVDFTKIQNSKYLENETKTFYSNQKNSLNTHKGYFMAKNSFAADVTFKTYLQKPNKIIILDRENFLNC